jgi:type II secretory pathway component PulC
MRATLVQVALRGLSQKFWIVGAATVTVCAALAARAAGQVVEARYLTDAPRAPTLPRVEREPAPPAPPTPSTGNAALLVERNMFCSDCVGAGDPEPSATGVIASTLPLVLVATSIGAEPWATLRNTESGAQGAFGVGDRIPRVGAVERIAGTWIEVMNDGAGRIERIELLAPVVASAGTAVPAAGKAAGAATTPANPYADRVRKIDDHTFEVDRQLVRDLVSGGKVDGVSIRPVTKGDQLLGIKVVRAAPSSVAAAIGLRAGDVIEGIDGAHIESAQQLVDMLARLDDVHKVHFDGTRKGAALGLDLHLR